MPVFSHILPRVSDFSTILISHFPSISLPWHRRTNPHRPKAREVFPHASDRHPWKPVLDETFSLEKKKKSLFPGYSGNDLKPPPLHCLPLIHQSCHRSPQTATVSPSCASHIEHKVLSTAAASPTLERSALLLQTPGLQTEFHRNQKPCLRTQGGRMLIFLKSDLTLLPSASK